VNGAEIHIGPAGWSYDDWRGCVYPQGAPSRFDQLAYLKDFYNTIEINSTFYHPPGPKTAESWVRRVDDNRDFIFTAKLWKHFTHEPRTLDGKAIEQVKESFQPLNDSGRLGAVLCQFPWSFKGDKANARYLKNLFEAFSEYRLVLEVRHASWDKPDVYEWLREQGVAFCNIDQPVIGRSLDKTEEVTSQIGYFRLHGQNRENWFSEDTSVEERYNYLYDAEELEPWAKAVERLAPGLSRVFIIFNNHYQGQAPANALEMMARLSGDEVDVPDPLLKAFPRLEKMSKGEDEKES